MISKINISVQINFYSLKFNCATMFDPQHINPTSAFSSETNFKSYSFFTTYTFLDLSFLSFLVHCITFFYIFSLIEIILKLFFLQLNESLVGNSIAQALFHNYKIRRKPSLKNGTNIKILVKYRQNFGINRQRPPLFFQTLQSPV